MAKLYRQKQYKGKLYPTGEFSVGYDVASYTVEKRKSRSYERIHALQHSDLKDEEGNAWMRLPLDVAQVYCPVEVKGQEERLSLGLSTLRNQHNRPKRYGSKGITSYGRRMVKSAAYLLEEKYGKDRLTFATYTLPPMGAIFRWFLHENWGKFVKELFQEISRELKRKNAPDDSYVAVTEIQEKRLRAFGQVYLHLHAVWVGRKKGGGYYISTGRSDRILAMVLRRLALQCERETGQIVERWELKTKASGRLERVEKSVVNYLGKYMSKGICNKHSISDRERNQYFPRQWWTASARLKADVKARIQLMSHKLCSFLVDDGKNRQEKIEWIVPITKEWQGTVYTLGYVGRLRPGWESLLDSSEPEAPFVQTSKPQGSLDSSATIRIKRRRVPLSLPSSRSPSLRVVSKQIESRPCGNF